MCLDNSMLLGHSAASYLLLNDSLYFAELSCDVVAAWAWRDGPLERSLLRAGLQRPWARGVYRGARPSIAA